MNIKEHCQLLRENVETLEINVNSLHVHEEFRVVNGFQPKHSEMHSNITLAYRHLEDARMRLGKVIQAFDGGISCYTALK